MQSFNQTSLHLYSEYIEPEILSSFKNFFELDDIEGCQKSFLEIGNDFGFGKEFKLLLSSTDEERNTAENKLFTSFHNNVKLLVQKTWVEKNDQILKEQLLMRLETLCNEFQEKNYPKIYPDSFSVLTDVVSLMFGFENTEDADFAEYALRIDPGFGTFWCFLQSLPKENDWNIEKIRMAILLEILFLANY